MIKFIDLFAGLGGIRIALEKAGAECVFSSDIDRYAQDTYELNFGDRPHGDITKIVAKDIPDFDILCGGFPCQPFSIAGNRKGFDDTRGTLFFDVMRIVKEKRPAALILENVAGLLSHDGGRTLDIIMRALDEQGYYAKYRLLNARDYGVPQNRNRWYCIAIRKDIVPKEEFAIYDFYPDKSDLQYKVSEFVELNDKPEYEPYKISVTARKNIERHLRPEHKMAIASGKIVIANNIRPSKVSLSAHDYSPCLTAKMGTGGNNVPVVVNTMRKITTTEGLRIMGFPKDYKIKPNYSQSYKQIGNSVVVPIFEVISNKLVGLLKKRLLKS